MAHPDTRNGRIARMIFTSCENVEKSSLIALDHSHEYGWRGFDKITYAIIDETEVSTLEEHALTDGAITSKSTLRFGPKKGSVAYHIHHEENVVVPYGIRILILAVDHISPDNGLQYFDLLYHPAIQDPSSPEFTRVYNHLSRHGLGVLYDKGSVEDIAKGS